MSRPSMMCQIEFLNGMNNTRLAVRAPSKSGMYKMPHWIMVYIWPLFRRLFRGLFCRLLLLLLIIARISKTLLISIDVWPKNAMRTKNKSIPRKTYLTSLLFRAALLGTLPTAEPVVFLCCAISLNSLKNLSA